MCRAPWHHAAPACLMAGTPQPGQFIPTAPCQPRSRLLRAGADANAQDYDRRSALHVAAADGNLAVVKLLVEQGGARVQATDRCALPWLRRRGACSRLPTLCANQPCCTQPARLLATGMQTGCTAYPAVYCLCTACVLHVHCLCTHLSRC